MNLEYKNLHTSQQAKQEKVAAQLYFPGKPSQLIAISHEARRKQSRYDYWQKWNVSSEVKNDPEFWLNKVLTKSYRKLYLYFIRKSRKKGYVHKKIEYIASENGVSESTVKRASKYLQDMGVLRVAERRDYPNYYKPYHIFFKDAIRNLSVFLSPFLLRMCFEPRISKTTNIKRVIENINLNNNPLKGESENIPFHKNINPETSDPTDSELCRQEIRDIIQKTFDYMDELINKKNSPGCADPLLSG